MRLLYLTYWGALEPLGQALVIPPVKQLALRGFQIDLITFEKPQHWADDQARRRLKAELADAGISWQPRAYHQRPTIPATLFDLCQGLAAAAACARRAAPDLVIGRTYVGGLMGRAASLLLRRPFIFYNEGFWPDEQVEARVWGADSLSHRLASGVLNGLHRSADGVVALSQRARNRIIMLRNSACPDSVIQVSSSVDLAAFPAGVLPPAREGMVYIGSLGGRYQIEKMAAFVRASFSVMGEQPVTILSHSDHAMIARRLQAGGLEPHQYRLGFVRHEEMAAELGRYRAGLFFLADGPGAHACSPTKIGEYWAAGLPVVSTNGVGDVDEIVRRERVGVLIGEGGDAQLAKAARELADLLADPELPARCRRAAERHYALMQTVDRQAALYRRLGKSIHAG